MTKITIFRNFENVCVGFEFFDHAGYADEGSDIVCAAISILTINTMNAIEQFTDVDYTQDVDEEECSIEFKIHKSTKDTTLLLDTPLVLL